MAVCGGFVKRSCHYEKDGRERELLGIDEDNIGRPLARDSRETE